ncbi:MAG: hypothetical protein WA883_17845 [Phormidesmis sp.]
MIALKPPDKSSRLGFKYLRPTEGEETKPFKKEQPSQKRVRRSRLLNIAFALVYGGAALSAGWFSAAQSVPVVLTEPEPVAEATTLWDQLGFPEFQAWQQRYQIEKTTRLLAEAEQDRETARDYKVIASQALAASFLPHSPGEAVITTTRVAVDCFDDGDLGFTAVINQMEPDSPYVKQGVLGNLAECYPGTRGAGGAIGKAGKFQPTVRE